MYFENKRTTKANVWMEWGEWKGGHREVRGQDQQEPIMRGLGAGGELAFYSRFAGGVAMREPVAASCRRGCLAAVVEVAGLSQWEGPEKDLWVWSKMKLFGTF